MDLWLRPSSKTGNRLFLLNNLKLKNGAIQMMNTNKYGYVSRTEANIFGELDRKPKKSHRKYDHKKDSFKGSGFVKTQVRHYDHNEELKY